MAYDLIIRNGLVVTAREVVGASIAIADERIVEVAPDISGAAREEIDATGLHILPGVIDPHVHFNEPGRTDWEGIATGSASLAAGGGTCFFDMPLNSIPPTLDGISFDLKRKAAEQSSVTDFGLWGGLTPKNLDRMEELARRGVVGFKAFMSDSGVEEFPRADDLTLLRGMKIAAKLGRVVAVHAESQEITLRLTGEAMAAGRRTARDYHSSRPVIAEAEAISRACLFAEETGCPLHIVHVSSPRGVEVFQEALDRGVNVTCETCPHYLTLCEEDAERIGAAAKCAPPLRPREQMQRLHGQLGPLITFVASDHSPCPQEMKSNEDPFRAWGGIAGVQTTLPILLTKLSDPRPASRYLASRIARRFNIPGKGRVETGFDGDLSLLDLNAEFTVSAEQLHYRHKISPYIGMTFRGVVRRTLVRGMTVFLNGKIVAQPLGRLVRPT